MGKWGDTKTQQFVQLYGKYENLWNPKHPFYKAKDVRQRTYKELITEFRELSGISLTIEELTSKIKILRSTYKLELDKVIKTRHGDVPTYKPKIKWFPDMYNFLKEVQLRGRKIPPGILELDSTSTENTGEKVWVPENKDFRDSDTEDQQKQWMTEKVDVINNQTSCSFNSENNEDYLLILKPDPDDESIVKMHTNNSYKVRQKKTRLSGSNFSESYKDRPIASAEESKEDEFEIYGKFIASQLRSLSLQGAIRLQLEIQNLVSSARLAELSNKDDRVNYNDV